MLSALLHESRWRAAWGALFLGLIVVISWLAFSSRPPPSADLGWDKANHFAAFAVLTFTGLQALAGRRRPRWSVLAMMLTYAVLIELIQAQIPGRDAEARDVLADMIGAAIGLALHAAVTRWVGPDRRTPLR